MKPPRYIYKYHPINIHLIELLVNGEFYLATREQLNDPMDSSFTITFEDYLRLYLERYPSLKDKKEAYLTETFFNWKTEAEKIEFVFQDLGIERKEQRITCFSEDGNNPLMWSHYAANNTGVCLKFDLEKDPRLRESLTPITYLEELIAIKTNEDVLRCASTKLKYWQQEKEWRIVNDSIKFRFEKDCLIEIVLGTNVPDSVYTWLDTLCENVYYDTPIHHMKIRNKPVKLSHFGDEVPMDFIPETQKKTQFDNMEF
jgi:hypothetical protein